MTIQPATGATIVRDGDARDLDACRAAIRPNTKLLFGETLGNPSLDVLDVPAVAAYCLGEYRALHQDA